MNVQFRKYKMFSDFQIVSDFYAENYKLGYWYITQPAFEYAHTHDMFNHVSSHRFGIWEDVNNGNILATVCFEMDLGECLMCIKEGFEYLREDILRYAESELPRTIDGKYQLDVWSANKEIDAEFLIENGYSMMQSEPTLIYKYENGFKDVKLPEGFTLISLEDENDIEKIDRCLHYGFHSDEPYRDRIDGRLYSQTGPNFQKKLTTIVKAPNGEYACYAGMWVDFVNEYAYLEPLATVPKYRRMGIATATLMEAMRKTVSFGAKYCYGGSREFYRSIGFEKIGSVETWRKEW